MSRSSCQKLPASPELCAEWERLLAIMPEAARVAITPELWNQEWLHALELPVREMAISDLSWLFDVPLWAVDEKPFQVTPNQVRTHPRKFAAQYKRTIASDLVWPIHVMRFRGRWIVLDGVHRLLKADLSGKQSVRVMVLSPDDYNSIVFPSKE